MLISVVIPAYNEEKRLSGNLEKILGYLEKHFPNYELIIVDDGSVDGTIALAKTFSQKNHKIRILANERNRGKGYSVKKGMLAAKGEITVFMDADLSTPIEEMEKLVETFEENDCDIVIGTRKNKEAKVLKHQSFFRESLGKGFTFLSNSLAVKDISDFTCGFKGFKRKAAQHVFSLQRVFGWSFDTEIIYIAHRNGYRIKEMPVSWTNSPDTKVQLWRDVVGSFLGLLNIRWNDFLGRYRKKKSNFWFLTLLTLPLLVFFAPFLFSGEVFFGGDLVLYYLPVLNFFKQNPSSYLWASGMLSGFPVYVSLTGGFFNIFNRIFFGLFSLVAAYNWIVFLNFFLGGFFTYCFVRSLRLNRTASLIASLSYVFSHWAISYGPNVVFSNFFFLLPLLFLCLLKLSQEKYWYFFLGVLGLGSGFLSGHPQFILFILIAAGFYALFLAWGRPKKFLILALLMVLIGSLLGSWQLIPSQKFGQLSSRAELSCQEAAVDSLNPVYLATYLFPYFQIPHFSWGRGLFYIGFLPLFFFLASFFYRRRSKNISFFFFLYFFALLSALVYSPLFWLMHHLPVLKYFRVPMRWIYLSVFSSSVLAAYGYQYFSKNPLKVKKLIKIFQCLVAIVAALVVLINLVFWLFGEKIISLSQAYFENHLYRETTQLPLIHYFQLIERYIREAFGNVSLLNYQFLIPLAFLLLGWYVIKIHYRKKTNLKTFKILVISFIVANFLLVYQGQNKALSQEVFFRTPETVKMMSGDYFRIYSFLPGFSEYQKLIVPYDASPQDRFIFESEMIAPNLNLLYGLDSVDGYDNIMPRNNAELLAQIGSERATVGEKLAEKNISLEEKINEFVAQKDLLSRQNVKYIISAYELPWELVGTVEATRFQIPIYVYLNPDFWPRAYWVEELDSDKWHEVEITNYQNGLIEAEVVGPGWLVFNESNLPVWEAYLDGQPAEIHPANLIYQAVELPFGEHKVKFIYQGVK